ncbi:MMPL family transporter [Streptomyces sp. NPDC045431]|uniref:MMPL family transporter n=1 Tax=Streptomyces sp. NPDC045431 TaxID=3155613 RepID=UPI0033E63BD1
MRGWRVRRGWRWRCLRGGRGSARCRRLRRAGRGCPAGRTVIFSGVTVAVSLSALLVFPFFFLSSFAYAGVLVVLTAVAGVVVVLPAALARWGHRMERPPSARTGLWHRVALRAMRKPVLSGAAVLGVLLLAASPVLGLCFGQPDERTLPEGTPSRTTSEAIHRTYAAEPTDVLQVVVDGPATPAELTVYAAELARVPGVFQVDPPEHAPNGGAVRIGVVPTQEAMYGDVPALVERVRAVAGPPGVLVGGYPAETTDFRTTLLDRLPVVIALILVATFVILFLMTGSLLLPAKATVLNLLSLSVMSGCLVYVFQDGHFADLLGFTPTGSIEPSIPVLMFCVVYGLSMDYEVLMPARIKEEYERTGDTERAVVAGIRRSAPLITAAAGILALSFAAYATGGVVFLKELGVGTALAILVDATLIRVVLLPVSMRLAGRANRWAPAPLRRLHRRAGLSEAVA